MANKRISELTSITGANLADADLLVVVDVSDQTMAASGTNKKVTLEEFAQESTFSSRYAPLPGAWTTWTPTVTSESGTITTVTTNAAKYVQLGKVIHASFDITVTTKGTASGALIVSLPVNTASPALCALGVYRERANTGSVGSVFQLSASTVGMRRYDNLGVFANDGDRFVGSFTYETV